MTSPRSAAALTMLLLGTLAAGSPAQTFRSADSVVRRIWVEGMERSQTEKLAQVLIDSIGPRLSGTAGYGAAVDWLVRTYGSWGVTARREQYGTWRGWRQGPTHMNLVAPRVQSLEVELLAWSPGTERPVEGEAVLLPTIASPAEGAAWLRAAKGKYVLVSTPEVMCRAPQELARFARPETVTRLEAQRTATRDAWAARIQSWSPKPDSQIAVGAIEDMLHHRLDSAQVAGIVTSLWSAGWGVNKIFDATAERVPTVDLSCEDYGLIYRLAANNQGPRLRLQAEAAKLPDSPMFNVIAELRGTELPNEYVMLSAHLDSWHGATGATDNGTGTITMLEAMRLLRTAYPRPRRTILVGHWGGEEQGLNGSGSFVADHPEVMSGLQVLFNQDNGTWRAETIELQGFLKAGSNVARWLSHVPTEITSNLRLDIPGNQDNRGSDHSSFVCSGAPGLRLQSAYPEYRQYTWHTNRDTYDKIVFDDLKNNATLAAMMMYLASEDPERVPRDQAVLPLNPQTGQPRTWPRCGQPRRSYTR